MTFLLSVMASATGILDGTAGADVGVTTTSASAITADEIIDLFYSLNVPYRKDAIPPARASAAATSH